MGKVCFGNSGQVKREISILSGGKRRFRSLVCHILGTSSPHLLHRGRAHSPSHLALTPGKHCVCSTTAKCVPIGTVFGFCLGCMETNTESLRHFTGCLETEGQWRLHLNVMLIRCLQGWSARWELSTAFQVWSLHQPKHHFKSLTLLCLLNFTFYALVLLVLSQILWKLGKWRKESFHSPPSLPSRKRRIH